MSVTTAPTAPPKVEKPTPPDEVVAMGALMTTLGQDPKYRRRILEILRDANPSMPIPELDVEHAVTERVNASTAKITEENTRLNDRLASLESTIRRDRWATEHGLSEEEMGELETFAKEKKVGDPEAALEYFELGRPRRTPTPVSMTEDLRKAYYKNPKATALREGERVLAELRRKRGA
jgi:hypothetical protein